MQNVSIRFKSMKRLYEGAFILFKQICQRVTPNSLFLTIVVVISAMRLTNFSVHFYIHQYVRVLSPTLKLRSVSKVSSLLDSKFIFDKKSSFYCINPPKRVYENLLKLKKNLYFPFLVTKKSLT